jgi:hypothetical protein
MSSDDGAFRHEPPTDPTHCLRLRRRYIDAELQREIDDFNSFKARCLNQASLAADNPDLPGPPPNAPEQLRAGKVRIAKLREELSMVDEQLAATPEALQRKQLAALHGERQSRHANLIAEIAAIDSE